MLDARGDNARFTKASQALFGSPATAIVKEARTLLQSWKRPQHSEELEMISAEGARETFESVLTDYGLRDWNVKFKSNAISDVSIGKKTIFLRSGASFSRERLQSLIAHEIETHVLTSENGSKQSYELFERGCAGYLETQEGLAIYNQNSVLSVENEKRYWPAASTLAVRYGDDHSFAKLRAYIRRLGFDDVRALRTCFKVKRGMTDTSKPGAFTKELVYFRGWKLVTKFLEDGGDLNELYKGKINLHDIDLVRNISDLIDPVYLPR